MVDLSHNLEKESAFQNVEKSLRSFGLCIHSKDDNRPWGGFFVIEDSSLDTFLQKFFPDFHSANQGNKQPLSPKILIIEPGKRLSWQYHKRRSELWKVVHGPVGIILSDTDTQSDSHSMNTGEKIIIDCGQRHRLIGLNNWAVIAEIWKHTDPDNPSSENDIIRLDDDFGR